MKATVLKAPLLIAVLFSSAMIYAHPIHILTET